MRRLRGETRAPSGAVLLYVYGSVSLASPSRHAMRMLQSGVAGHAAVRMPHLGCKRKKALEIGLRVDVLLCIVTIVTQSYENTPIAVRGDVTGTLVIQSISSTPAYYVVTGVVSMTGRLGFSFAS